MYTWADTALQLIALLLFWLLPELPCLALIWKQSLYSNCLLK